LSKTHRYTAGSALKFPDFRIRSRLTDRLAEPITLLGQSVADRCN